MKILALDSSGKTASVCILSGGKAVYGKVLNAGLTHSETLCPLVEEGLAECAYKAKDIDLFALSAGPGSFTGLRIGMALVKGMCLPWNTPIAPVSTIAAIACSLEESLGQEKLLVVPALDARRGEVYWGMFLWEHGEMKRIHKDRAGSASEIEEKLPRNPAELVLVGDGAKICYNTFGGRVNARLHGNLPDIAYGAAKFAASKKGGGIIVDPWEARPVYLRLSQAERQRLEGK